MQTMKTDVRSGWIVFFLLAAVSAWATLPNDDPMQPSAPRAVFMPRFLATGTLTLLDISGIQQTTDYTCGPAALVSLMRYYGMNGSETDIASQVRAVPCSGTTPMAMTDWLNSHGFEANWGEACGSEGLKLLRANLEKGCPTLVEWIDWGGHWVICVGYDNRGTPETDDDDVLFADPYDRTDGIRDGITRFNAERFDSMWFDAHCFPRPMARVFIEAFPKGLVKK